jgi:hypothetical protein
MLDTEVELFSVRFVFFLRIHESLSHVLNETCSTLDQLFVCLFVGFIECEILAP